MLYQEAFNNTFIMFFKIPIMITFFCKRVDFIKIYHNMTLRFLEERKLVLKECEMIQNIITDIRNKFLQLFNGSLIYITCIFFYFRTISYVHLYITKSRLHKTVVQFYIDIFMYRYKEKDSRTPNWIELPVHPPEARRVQIHNLSQGTIYEFQVN